MKTKEQEDRIISDINTAEFIIQRIKKMVTEDPSRASFQWATIEEAYIAWGFTETPSRDAKFGFVLGRLLSSQMK